MEVVNIMIYLIVYMLIKQHNAIMMDGLVTMVNTSYPPITYSWYDNNNNLLSNNNNISSICIGNYSVSVVDIGCVDTSNNVSLTLTYGCTDSTELNYDPLANTDDGSCILPIYGCTDSTNLTTIQQ